MEIVGKYNDPRRTEIVESAGDIDWDELIQREDMVVTMTRQGYIKRTSADTYRTQNRGGMGIQGAATREEDFVMHLMVTSTHDWLLAFTNRGRIYRLRCYQLPEGSRQARGTYIANLLPLEASERVCTLIPVDENYACRNDCCLLMVTRTGTVKRTPLEEFSNLRNVGLRAVNLDDGDELVGCLLTGEEDDIILGTRKGLAIRFSASDVRPMHRAAGGVLGIRLAEGDEVVDMAAIRDDQEILTVTENGYGKRTQPEEYRRQGRGGKGLRAMAVTEKTGNLVSLMSVDDSHDLMLIASDGTLLRTRAASVPTISRANQGVRLMRLRSGETVSTAAIVEPDEDDPAQDLEVSEEDILNASAVEDDTAEE